MRPRTAAGVWSPELHCHIRAFLVNVVAHSVVLDMPAGVCCDMPGCVAFFTRLDPDCRFIATFAGGAKDTVYVKHSGGAWEAVPSGPT